LGRMPTIEADHELLRQEKSRRKKRGYVKMVKKARTHFDAFMEFCFADLETGAQLKQGAIHKKWTKHINRYSKAMILAPREHGKTEQIAIGRALFHLGRNQALRVKIVCQDDRSAVKRLSAIKLHIESNSRIREVFPNLKPHPTANDWSKTTITVIREGADKDPSMEASGILSTGTGGRCDLIIFDDVVDFRNAIAQPALREMVKEVFKNVWSNLLTRKSRAIYIATPWHEDDLTAELQTNPEWSVLRMPVLDDLVPIWKGQWTTARLAQRKNEIGNRAFGRGFHLVAITGEDQLFESIDNCIHPEYSLHDIDPSWPTYAGVDLGHSKRKQTGRRDLGGKEKPYSVIFLIAVDPDGRRWPKDIRRGHWSGPETGKQIMDVHAQFDPDVIMVENNAYQETIVDWIKLTAPDKSIRLKTFTTGKNKADEAVGLPSLAAEFDNRSWIIPTDGEDRLAEVNNTWGAWYDEMKFFPAMALSDTVMACWFAREASRKAVTPFMVSEGDDDNWQKDNPRARVMGTGTGRAVAIVVGDE